jgi:hypothetical protein
MALCELTQFNQLIFRVLFLIVTGDPGIEGYAHMSTPDVT